MARSSQLDVPHSSLIEYARPLAILTDEEELRKALLRSGPERNRQELDGRVARDALLSTIAAPDFNDISIRPLLEFSGRV